MNSAFWDNFLRPSADPHRASRPPQKVSVRTFGEAIEAVLMTYTRVKLEVILEDELNLEWLVDDSPIDADSKRALIQGYVRGWRVPQLAGLARRIVTELDVDDSYLGDLVELSAAFDAGGGVQGAAKNLIFAANGPKPEIVLRDAMNNDIQIVKNAEFCLVYDEPVPAGGLRFSRLVSWWRERENITASTPDRDVALRLHERLSLSLDSEAERVVFEAYAGRYRKSFDIPAQLQARCRCSGSVWTSFCYLPTGVASSSKSTESITMLRATRQAQTFTHKWSPKTVDSGWLAMRCIASAEPSYLATARKPGLRGSLAISLNA